MEMVREVLDQYYLILVFISWNEKWKKYEN